MVINKAVKVESISTAESLAALRFGDRPSAGRNDPALFRDLHKRNTRES